MTSEDLDRQLRWLLCRDVSRDPAVEVPQFVVYFECGQLVGVVNAAVAAVVDDADIASSRVAAEIQAIQTGLEKSPSVACFLCERSVSPRREADVRTLVLNGRRLIRRLTEKGLLADHEWSWPGESGRPEADAV